MDLSQALNTFIDESHELLSQMESILLSAESGDCSDDELNALFRCAHTIKGSAGLFGLDELVRFTHVVENLLDRLRAHTLEFSPELVSLLLASKDQIAALIGAVVAKEQFALDEELLAILGNYDTSRSMAQCASETSQVTVEPSIASGTEHWHLSLRFGPDVLRNGMDPLAFIRYLGNLSRHMHVETLCDHLPAIAEYDPETCYLGFEVSLEAETSKAELESVFEFVLDDAHIVILPPDSKIEDYVSLIQELPEGKQRLGELLLACGSITPSELESALSLQRKNEGLRLGEILVGEGHVQSPVVDAALAKQKRGEERRQLESRSVKVPSDRLDALIDQVGELVISCAATQVQARRAVNPELLEAAANLLRLVEEVRDTALRLRMSPIGEVFGRFPRVVRDVAKELGKEIELQITGADAELDKAMIEKISDPLMHLVRNAIDHGIESPERRLASGKDLRGTVCLNAYHESGSIVIEVTDDGAGLDPAHILRKAVQRGVVTADVSLSDAEIFRLILEPGFSTAETVTNLSGRGVGMDVVRSGVETLRGNLDILSELGCGTTMRICLPLTLAIIDGFQIGIGASAFIFPLDAVVECIDLPADIGHSEYLNLRGEVLPFMRLGQLFGISSNHKARHNVVVVRFGGKSAGIVVDQLHGECQAVIKPLGPLFSGVAGISGSTILGSGEVALILDVPQLVQLAAAGAGGRSAAAYMAHH
ncbi:MAG: chemotaxis protein CheA [Gammaproteobacteria bacterium]|nr:chemotaxis protein CheA [Gammaproteobacteria bacterium]